MTTARARALIPLAALILAACGDDDVTSDTTETTVTTVPATDAATTTVLTTVPGTTAPQDTTPETAIDGPVQIDVMVGVDSGPDRIVPVQVGEDITLNLTNPSAPDEFHIHGIELEQEADAGQMITWNFVIDTPGTYEVESHVTEDVLVVIEAT
jgi:hypothetical protein